MLNESTQIGRDDGKLIRLAAFHDARDRIVQETAGRRHWAGPG